MQNKVLLPEIMLSTDKAYSQEEVGKWLERIKKSAIEIDVDIHTIQIKSDFISTCNGCFFSKFFVKFLLFQTDSI
jgi:hypothetical protein